MATTQCTDTCEGAGWGCGLWAQRGATVDGGLVVTNTALTGADLICLGDAQIAGAASVGGNATIGGFASIAGNSSVGGNSSVTGTASVTGHTTMAGGAAVQGGLAVQGGATFGSVPNSGLVDMYSTVRFHGDVILDAPISGSLADNSVTSAKIVDGSVAAADLAAGSVATVCDSTFKQLLARSALSTWRSAGTQVMGVFSSLRSLNTDGVWWMSVGTSDGASLSIFRSRNGHDWASLSASSGDWYGAAGNGGRWVLVGAAGAIATTSSLESFSMWSSVTSGTTQLLRRVAHDGVNRWVAVGDGGTIVTSTGDATTWAVVTSGTTAQLNDVTHNRLGRWMVVGANGTILTSNDGTNWGPSGGGSGTTVPLLSVAHDGSGLWLVAGTSLSPARTVVFTSPNGGANANWTIQRDVAVGYPAVSVAFAKGDLITTAIPVVSFAGALLFSFDFQNWWLAPNGFNQIMRDMKPGPGGSLIQVGDFQTTIVSGRPSIGVASPF